MISTIFNAIVRTFKLFISRLRAQQRARRRTDFRGVIVRAWLEQSAYDKNFNNIVTELEYLDYTPHEYIREFHARSGGRDIIYKVEVRRPTRRWRDVYEATDVAIKILKPFTTN